MNEAVQSQAAIADKEIARGIPFFDAENLKFQAHLIEPKAQDFIWMLTRDEVLGNIDRGIVASMIERLHFSIELESLGFNDAAELVYSEVKSYLIISRSVDGFQQKQLATAYVHRTGTETTIAQAADAGKGGFFRRFMRR